MLCALPSHNIDGVIALRRYSSSHQYCSLFLIPLLSLAIARRIVLARPVVITRLSTIAITHPYSS